MQEAEWTRKAAEAEAARAAAQWQEAQAEQKVAEAEAARMATEAENARKAAVDAHSTWLAPDRPASVAPGRFKLSKPPEYRKAVEAL